VTKGVPADGHTGSRALAWGLAAALTTAACAGGAVQPDPPPSLPAPSASPSASPPPVTSTTPVAIAAVGDIACGSQRPAGVVCRDRETSELVASAEEILEQPLDAVLALGDLQYENGVVDDFRRFYDRTWGRFRVITHPVPGNHEYDVIPRVADGYFSYWNGTALDGPAGRRDRGYYSFNLRDWHFVALNSNCEYVPCFAGSPQERWLREDLQANTKPCTLAYWHHPRFSSGPSGRNEQLRPFWQALYDFNADVVLVAHDHLYERLRPLNPDGAPDELRGLRQLTVGTGGRHLDSFSVAALSASEFRSRAQFGVLLMTLGAGRYSWNWVTIDNSATAGDSGSATCH